MAHLKSQGILAVFHYVPLHSSPMGQRYGYRGDELPVTNDFSSRLLRLPLYYEILEDEQREVVGHVTDFLRSRGA
jgi:dTDP-4-amino-4,6-dideoxygalactose transaminase